MNKMTRWVERRGNVVEFGNVVGGFCGSPYIYQFEFETQAQDAATYLKGIDPDGLPRAFGPEIQARFNAQRV